jgi:two-component system chemotaxis sensor kinase CheA
MLDMFIFETTQQVEQLEQTVIDTELEETYSESDVNQIFRIMHTIKSSSAMMLFNNISKTAHCTEDLFYYIRENKPQTIDKSSLCDLVLESIDFIKLELEKIKNGDPSNGDEEPIINKIKEYLESLKQINGQTSNFNKNKDTTKKQFYISSNKLIRNEGNNIFKVIVFFEDGCEMENIRAFTIIHNLEDISEDIIDNNDSCEIIKKMDLQYI